MLGLIGGQIVSFEPATLTGEAEFELKQSAGKLTLTVNGAPLVGGITFYRMSNHNHSYIHPRTGEFEIDNKARTQFRACFEYNGSSRVVDLTLNKDQQVDGKHPA